MLKGLLSGMHAGPYYVRIGRQRLSVRDAKSAATYDMTPVVGVKGEPPVIVSIGLPVAPDADRSINPFDHPRLVVSDYDAAEKVLAHAIREIAGAAWFRPSPVIVVHPLDKLDGGLSPLEERALLELAESAGAGSAHIWLGRQLSDQEVIDGAYNARSS